MAALLLFAIAIEVIQHGFYLFGIVTLIVAICSMRCLMAFLAAFCITRSLRR